MSSGNHSFEVTVVSAFGRGDLLAGELKTRGMDVALVDVSKALGERPLADLEGPFPMVRPNPLLPAHLEWLMSHSFDEVTNGFSIWLKDGPMEFRGPLADFYSSRPAIARFRDYFSSFAQSGKRGEALKSLRDLSYEERWISEFSHTFASNVLSANSEAHFSGEPFPLAQLVHSPLFTAAVVQKIRDEARQTGVQWFEAEGVLDAHAEKSVLSQIEVNAGRREVISSRSYVWCLSSEETASISRKVAQKLFPKGVITSDWAWRRFQVHSGKNALETVVPAYLVMIENIHFPWAYDNMVVLKRRKRGLSDLWVRLPSEKSKKPDQLKKFSVKLADQLRERFPRWQHELEPPWDEGPPLYPVFERESLRRFGQPGLSNVIFEGAEFLQRQDWAGRFQKQAETMLRLQIIKNQEEAKKAKKENKNDSALHAP